MEEKRKDALEMAEKKDEAKKESNEAPNPVSWEHGVTRHPNGLQLGNDMEWVF